MNLNQIKYFNAVYLYRSVSKAANNLHISQPSLSNCIKDLEDEFGVILFNRFHGGMEPTAYADTLFNLSKDIITKFEQTEHIMKDIKNVSRILRLGIPPMIASIFLPQILSDLCKFFPDLKLHIVESGREDLINKLSQGQVDMIFIPHMPAVSADLSLKKITTFEIACCVCDKWEISSKKTIKPTDLKDVPVVLFDDNFFQTDIIKKWFSSYNVKPNIILQTGQLSTVQSLVASGVAAGFLFKNISTGGEHIKYISTEEKIHTDISVVWRKDNYMSDVLEAFGDYIAKFNVN